MARQSEVDNFRTNVKRMCVATTQRQVAKDAGITPEYLSTMLSGKANPSLQIAEDISRALGMPLAALLGDPELFTARSA